MGGGQSTTHHVVDASRKKLPGRKKKDFLYEGGPAARAPRSFKPDPERQILRWVSTAVFEKHKTAVEVQSYWQEETRQVIISSNKRRVNEKIAESLEQRLDWLPPPPPTVGRERQRRHIEHLRHPPTDPAQLPIYEALLSGNVTVPVAKYEEGGKEVDLHAERRIRDAVEGEFNAHHLAGVKRPCLICALDLGLMNSAQSRAHTQAHVDDQAHADKQTHAHVAHQGPGWPSKAASAGYDFTQALEASRASGGYTHVTRDRAGKLTMDHDTDSEADE